RAREWRGRGLERRARGNGESRRLRRRREPLRGEGRLALPERGERRVRSALEAALGDVDGLAVAEEDDRRLEAPGDAPFPDARLALGVAQRSVPSRIVQRSRTASWARIASATAGGTSSSSARIMRASSRGRERA